MTDDDEATILARWRKEVGYTPIYPVTITAARYGGSYEGGTWCAFNAYPHHLPPDHDGSDIECMTFWRSDGADRVGRGSSPDAALADLMERVKLYGESERMRGQ